MQRWPLLPVLSWSWVCWVAHPTERNAVCSGSSQGIRGFRGRGTGLGKFPRSRWPIWWAYLSLGNDQDGCELCQKQWCGTLGRRDWVVRNCALLEAPGCVSWGLLMPQEIFPIQPGLIKGSLSIFSLQILSDAVSGRPSFTSP